MGSITAPIIKKMESMGENPLEYDELVLAWNTLCEQSWSDTEEFQFADIEKAAIGALSEEATSIRSGKIGNQISRMLDTFDYPTFIVSSDGRVAAINSAAAMEFEINIGDQIDLLPFSLDEAKQISVLLSETLNGIHKDADVIFKRAYGCSTDKEATIAITPSYGGTASTALVFIITMKWKPGSVNLLKRKFYLTDTETEILLCFLDGNSTQDIARLRKRSHATVRTQLQSLLAKTGARNQTELLRLVLSVSGFASKIGVIVDTVKHPHRRCAEILREGGRLIEVTLMGDMSGKPVLTIANATNYTFNPSIEQHLYDAGLYLISICSPGCGRTDPAPTKDNRLEYLRDDVNAVLQQLGIHKCPILAYNANSPVCYTVANRLSERISHVLHIAACVPPKFLTTKETQSSWATGMLKASANHPGMKLLLVKGAMKAWATMGAKQFWRLQMSSNPVDAKYILLPENLLEYEHALKTACQKGISDAAEDMSLLFGDWATEVESLETNVTVMHGLEDKVCTIESTRCFAASFPDKIELIEVKNAGSSIIQSHTKQVVDLLNSVVESHYV